MLENKHVITPEMEYKAYCIKMLLGSIEDWIDGCMSFEEWKEWDAKQKEMKKHMEEEKKI